MAESDDLFTWRRVGNRPLVLPDRRSYRTLDEDALASDTWRDPHVFRDARGEGWHMLISARAQDAPRLRDGILAHARSDDMLTWNLQPPLTEPAGFGQIEVPQVRILAGQALLVFTCHPVEQSPEQVARYRPFRTSYVLGDAPNGPWDVSAARPFVGLRGDCAELLPMAPWFSARRCSWGRSWAWAVTVLSCCRWRRGSQRGGLRWLSIACPAKTTPSSSAQPSSAVRLRYTRRRALSPSRTAPRNASRMRMPSIIGRRAGCACRRTASAAAESPVRGPAGS